MANTEGKPFKTWFIQDWGTYENKTLVIVGHTKAEILPILKKANSSEGIIKEWLDEEDDGVLESSAGFVMKFGAGANTLLWLRDCDKTLDWHDILVHEVLHLIQEGLMQYRCMSEEWEAQAYQQQYLVKSIRDKIYKAFDKYEGKRVVQKVPGRVRKPKSAPKV